MYIKTWVKRLTITHNNTTKRYRVAFWKSSVGYHCDIRNWDDMPEEIYNELLAYAKWEYENAYKNKSN